MADPSRGSSLPPRNESDEITTMINPAYSGSVAPTDSVHFSSSREAIVEIREADVSKPDETSSKKRIKYSRIVFSLLILILASFNIYHYVIWRSERVPVNIEVENDAISDLEVFLDIAILSNPGNSSEESPNLEASSTTEIPSTSISTTTTTTSTEQPTTTLSHREQMRETYRNFTEWHYHTFSESGLDKYVANAEFFSKGIANFEETQFADLSEEQLRKLLTSDKDRMREEKSKRCDIHTYFDKKQGTISGSDLYGSNDRIPSRVDLRRNGIIGDVRNQGTLCNAGYAFAVANLLESKVDTNGSRLSVQMLLADHFNHHCEGGETFRAMETVDEEGIVTEDVLPFDENQQWHDVDAKATRYRHGRACLLTGSYTRGDQYYDYSISKYRYKQENQTPASTYITHFLAKVGTVVVEVPVDRSFFFYKSGTYSPDCKAILGYQPAIVVGYGMRNKMKVWILRNSFGTEWGIDGDFEMSRDSNCGTFDYAFTFYNSSVHPSLPAFKTTMSEEKGKEMTIEIPMEEGEPLGATPNDKMIVTKVQAGTVSEGKLKIGDQILRVNDTVIKDTHHFFALLRFAPPCARLAIFRDEKKAEELASRVHIPADRERNITRRDGFSYELVKMTWKAGGPKLGLGIKHFQNRVLVSKTDPASISAECLKIGDHIVDINGQPVTDKDVARGILVKGLQAHGEVTMVIERPETMEAKHWTSRALTVQAVQPPSVQMNSDVRDIAQKERARLAAKVGKELKSILGGQKKAAAVAIDDRQFGHVIASDNEGKNLRAVKK